MPLTSDESRRLQELAQHLSAEDPRLARRLRAPGRAAAGRDRKRLLIAVWLVLAVAVALALVGIALSAPLVFGSGLAFFCAWAVGLGVMFWPDRSR